MITYYDINALKPYKRPVVVLGVFDGVHLAHARILRLAVKKARQTGKSCILLTFWPHPQKQESIYSLEHRLKLISGFGVDICLVVRFTPAFARIPAQVFARKFLLEKLSPAYIFIGKNFTFGRGAKGDYKMLKALCGSYDFKLKTFDVIKIKGRAVSSTYIRGLIKKGNLNDAAELLGRPVSILGTVVKGASLARRIGFPTANINPHHEVVPPTGVYAVEVMLNGKILKGACSIGTKPTLNTHKLQHIEVHIFDFKRDIYGKVLEIRFIRKIREQKKFPSLPALSKQIKKDILFIRDFLSRH
ncbi:MAG: riboflavin biosynthesis protein RibF [Candidatus Omnitrophica bacterium]|nr:riboflavin biosynthesis protein RibF [Candidatus Omnitrophota bacterium]